MQPTILLVEDDESLNRGISLKLTREGYMVHPATTLAEARRLFAAHPVDLVVCDIGLPDGSGLDFCAELRERSRVLFLFLTALDTELDIVGGYDAGADDYITKPFSLLVLISKVGALMKRARSHAHPSIRSGRLELHLDEKRVDKDGVTLVLSANEFKLLLFFMTHPRHILSKEQLLEAMWGTDSVVADENTVAVNIRRLREKIEEDPSRPRCIKNVRGMGYRWEMECEGL